MTIFMIPNFGIIYEKTLKTMQNIHLLAYKITCVRLKKKKKNIKIYNEKWLTVSIVVLLF